MSKRITSRALTLCTLILLLTSCGVLRLAEYDQKAYENATYLKAQTVALLKNVGVECSLDDKAIADWSLAMEAAYEYANGVDHNNEAALNWRALIDDLAVSPITACREALEQGDVPLSTVFFDEAMLQIKEGFDVLICLEANKRQASTCESLKASAD